MADAAPRPVVTVARDDVRLAVTDRGGDGRPVLLLHGLGGSQRSMAKVADRLTGCRVVTMDLRGHGRSSTAPFSFDAAVADVAAVVAHLGLDSPVVVGHSLGGMVALQYALAGHPTAGVVNIDGWGPGVSSRYVDEDPSQVDAMLDRVAAGDLGSRLAGLLNGLSRQAREGTTGQVLALLDRADVVARHAQVSCRALALHAYAPSGGLPARLLGADAARMQAAHRRGLSRDLAELAARHPSLTVVEVDATHSLITTHPDQVAAAVRSWLAAS